MQKHYFCDTKDNRHQINYTQTNGHRPIMKNSKQAVTMEYITEKLAVLLNPLTEEQRTTVMQCMKVQHLRKGELVYREGDMPDDLLCVVQGKLRLFKEGVAGRSHLIRILQPVSVTGHRSYFAGECYHSCAEAMEPTILVHIPLERLTEIIKDNAGLAWFFIQELSKRLGTANDRTVNLTQKHVRGRLAEVLLYLRDTYGVEEDGCTLSIYLSREDMASMSNMTTANAIRTLKAFAQEGLIDTNGKKIKLLNIEGLKDIEN